DRNPDLTPCHVSELGCLVDDLVGCQVHEAGNAEVYDGSQSRNCRADPDPGKGSFGDGRAPDPRSIEAIEDLAPAVDGNVLSHQDDGLVALHLLDLGLNHCLQITDVRDVGSMLIRDCCGHPALLTGSGPV